MFTYLLSLSGGDTAITALSSASYTDGFALRGPSPTMPILKYAAAARSSCRLSDPYAVPSLLSNEAAARMPNGMDTKTTRNCVDMYSPATMNREPSHKPSELRRNSIDCDNGETKRAEHDNHQRQLGDLVE
ncbi:unnamed protein product [Clonostachys rhizophaga]|uniref:Uncharacterized protein n=1 Tax=Clonostachys rhizophaga TaxID=160324 RepID=A0A9N9V5F1_9HYPO|nr:unnamed protein product [Clonostachys rhizophaga]